MDHEEFSRAAGYWKEKDKSAKKADRADVYAAATDFLGRNKTCALATGHGSEVRCTPVDYSFDGGAFYIFTEGGEKFSNLEKNQNVSISVFEGGGTFGKLHSVQVMGTAEFVEPFCAEYEHIAEIRRIPVNGLKKLKYPMYLLKVVPCEIILLDSSFKEKGLDSRQVWRRDEDEK
ncbi:MAG: pyridoxamine 5'-phosphate oxidase family protein [Oscillospiraceae bacterium]|nr:pyridoxamine 5'-phosphate oxidase family protein [Oscillospiraceae bacterium]